MDGTPLTRFQRPYAAAQRAWRGSSASARGRKHKNHIAVEERRGYTLQEPNVPTVHHYAQVGLRPPIFDLEHGGHGRLAHQRSHFRKRILHRWSLAKDNHRLDRFPGVCVACGLFDLIEGVVANKLLQRQLAQLMEANKRR